MHVFKFEENASGSLRPVAMVDTGLPRHFWGLFLFLKN